MRAPLKIFFPSFLFFYCSFSFAQTYPLPTTGAQWNVLIDDPNSGSFCTAIYKYEKDTFVCGYNYSIVSLQNPAQCFMSNPIYLRSSGDTVWGRLVNCNYPEYLLYNFALATSDTFATYFFDTAVVLNVSYPIMTNGQIRKRIVLKSINPFIGWQYEWIEGIGDLTQLFYLQILSDPVFTLLCFSDSSGLVYSYSDYYGDPLWNTCDTTSTGINEIIPSQDNNMIIYPNPSNGQFIIKYELLFVQPAEIIVYDITGKPVRTFDINKSRGEIVMYGEKLNKGIYLCTLKAKDEHIISSKIFVLTQ